MHSNYSPLPSPGGISPLVTQVNGNKGGNTQICHRLLDRGSEQTLVSRDLKPDQFPLIEWDKVYGGLGDKRRSRECCSSSNGSVGLLENQEDDQDI